MICYDFGRREYQAPMKEIGDFQVIEASLPELGQFLPYEQKPLFFCIFVNILQIGQSFDLFGQSFVLQAFLMIFK